MTHAWPSNFPLVASEVETSVLVRASAFRPSKERADLTAALALFDSEPFGLAVSHRHTALCRMVMSGAGTRLLVPVPPSTEAGNVLALAYALTVGRFFQVPVDFTRKLNVAKHTGMSSLTRFTQRPVWDVSEVRKGCRYLMVDDVMTSGVSLAEMRRCAMQAGALVAGVTTLAYTAITDKQRASVMTPLHFAVCPATVRCMTQRFGDADLTAFFRKEGIYDGQWRAMTEGEAWLIRHYRTVADFEAAVSTARLKERAAGAAVAVQSTLGEDVSSPVVFDAWRANIRREGFTEPTADELPVESLVNRSRRI